MTTFTTLNIHHFAVNCLKAILDYDLEDENHANVLVKHGVVKNVQSHKTNVQTLLNGFIIFNINSVSSVHRSPSQHDQWKNHWMILPKKPYLYE